MTGLPDPSERAAFLATVQGKLISVLAIIALVLGIAAEGVSLYRNLMETHTATEVSINAKDRQDAEARISIQRAEIELQTAKNAAVLKEAEAKKMKADSCSARMKYMAELSTLEELQHPGKKWDDLNCECDPNYAAQADACDKDFDAILADLDKIHNDEEGKPVLERFNKHKINCVITAEQRQRFAAFKEKNDKEVEKIHKAQAVIEILKIKVSIKKEEEARHYDKAFELTKKRVELSEAWDNQYADKSTKFTPDALLSLSFFAIFAHEYTAAIAATDRARVLEPDNIMPLTNRAHALMFLGRTDEAKAAYLAHRGEKIGKHDWNYYIADDFKQLRDAGLSHPFMTDIERELGLQSAATTAPEPKKANP